MEESDATPPVCETEDRPTRGRVRRRGRARGGDHGLAAHVYIAKGEETIETDTYTGIRLHSHSAAAGKVLLAFSSDAYVRDVLDRRGLPDHGPNCITSREAFMEELADIRDRGVAFDRQERIEGIRSVAVPLPRDDSESDAAISISGPISRMNGERFEETIPERLENIAETIRIKIRYA